MANYLQFHRVLEREKTPRRLTYICGDQPVLVEDVVDTIRLATGLSSDSSVTLFAGTSSVGRVWSEANQHAIDPKQSRLVVVREAEKFEGWDQLTDWLQSRAAPSVNLVFVAAEPCWPSQKFPDVRNRIVKSSKSLYVECSLPKSEPERVAVDVLLRWSGLSTELAKQLLKLTSMDLARCRDVCQWIDMLPGKVSPAVLDLLVESKADDGYVSALLRLDKGSAASHAQYLTRSQIAPALLVLSRRLLELEQVQRALGKVSGKGSDPAQLRLSVARQSGLSVDKVIALWEAARHYDAEAVRRRMELLVRAGEAHDQPGVLEMLAVAW